MNASWTTDDGRFEFRFFLTPDEEMEYALRVEFYYVNRQGIPRPLWEIDPMPYNMQVPLEDLPVVDEYSAKGWLRLNIVEQENGGHLVLFAEIIFIHQFDEYEFEGPIFVKGVGKNLPPEHLPLPSTDPEPSYDNSVEEAEITHEPVPIKPEAYEDLFPYVYMRSWPQLNAKELALSFASYQPSPKWPHGNAFYLKLRELKKQQNRAGMEQEANVFLEGQAPYTSSRLYEGSLHGPICWFSDLLREIRSHASLWDRATLETTLTRQLASWTADLPLPPLESYLQSPSYLMQKEAAWQTYFALILKLGYEPRWLDTLSRTLIMCHILEYLVEQQQASPPPAQETDGLYGLVFASILLPDTLFPLPTYRLSSPPDSGRQVSVYAIGDLQLVQQRFLRYETGEIAYIVNVLPGERKEVVTRKLDSNQKTETQTQEDSHATADQTDEQGTNLDQAVQETLGTTQEVYTYGNLETSYGPPTNLSINGNWKRDISGKSPTQNTLTSFAKNILNRTHQKISERISRSRKSHILSEQEEIVTSVYDNLNKETPMCMAYRWLNKVYQAQVINYGERLMLAFSLQRPAARYMAQTFSLTGDNLEEPLTLAQKQILSFKTITPENYVELVSYYEVDNIVLPPPATMTVSETLSGSEGKLISLPDGYLASEAYITYSLPKAGTTESVEGTIGRKPFSSIQSTSPITLARENTSIPVSASVSYPPSSPPSDALDSVHVAIEVVCVCSDQKMDEWRVKVYASLQQASKRKRAVYFEQFGEGVSATPSRSNPMQNRHIVREELKRGCLSELMKGANPNLESPFLQSSPPMQAPAGLRYREYLAGVFEWQEMTYSFTDVYAARSNTQKYPVSLYDPDDQAFSAFLQADSAKVILPVRKEFSYSILYFLQTGDIWVGEDDLAPSLAQQTALVHHLTETLRTRTQPYVPLEAWEITLPTTLQVLSQTETWSVAG